MLAIITYFCCTWKNIRKQKRKYVSFTQAAAKEMSFFLRKQKKNLDADANKTSKD